MQILEENSNQCSLKVKYEYNNRKLFDYKNTYIIGDAIANGCTVFHIKDTVIDLEFTIQ